MEVQLGSDTYRVSEELATKLRSLPSDQVANVRKFIEGKAPKLERPIEPVATTPKPNVPNVPKVPKVPKVSKVPKAPKVPKIPKVSKFMRSLGVKKAPRPAKVASVPNEWGRGQFRMCKDRLSRFEGPDIPDSVRFRRSLIIRRR
jgi:hypothetical protein